MLQYQILLAKLCKYNIRGPALELFRLYLANRQQYVKLNDVKSGMKLIDIGIPQGSVLGPLLFLLYINDLPNASNFFTKLFADDTVLTLSGKSIQELNKQVNLEIKKIYDWLVANRLTLNTGKSKFMIITKKRVQNHDFKVKINGTQLEKCSSYKYLGLHFDDNLNWKSHVNYVVKKVSKMCRIISKLRHSVNIDILKTVYYALGYSYLRY